MRHISILALLFSLCFDARASLCEQAPQALAQQHCSATQHAAIYANDSARAEQAASVVDQLAENFVRYFGKSMPLGAVYEHEGSVPNAEIEKALRQLGARWVLAMPRSRGGLPEEIRTRLQEQMKDRSEADIANAMKQVEQQLGGLATANDGVLHRALRYRIAHAAMNALYWPKANLASDAYGTPAADWIDEAALTLFDEAQTAEGRRAQLGRELANGAVAFSALQARSHPAQPMLGRGGAGGITVQRISATDASAIAKANPMLEAARMQAFARSWAEYLIERNPRAFGALYSALAQGKSFEAWLQTEGEALGLAKNSAALETAWHAWLAQR